MKNIQKDLIKATESNIFCTILVFVFKCMYSTENEAGTRIDNTELTLTQIDIYIKNHVIRFQKKNQRTTKKHFFKLKKKKYK